MIMKTILLTIFLFSFSGEIFCQTIPQSFKDEMSKAIIKEMKVSKAEALKIVDDKIREYQKNHQTNLKGHRDMGSEMKSEIQKFLNKGHQQLEAEELAVKKLKDDLEKAQSYIKKNDEALAKKIEAIDAKIQKAQNNPKLNEKKRKKTIARLEKQKERENKSNERKNSAKQNIVDSIEWNLNAYKYATGNKDADLTQIAEEPFFFNEKPDPLSPDASKLLTKFSPGLGTLWILTYFADTFEELQIDNVTYSISFSEISGGYLGTQEQIRQVSQFRGDYKVQDKSTNYMLIKIDTKLGNDASDRKMTELYADFIKHQFKKSYRMKLRAYPKT